MIKVTLLMAISLDGKIAKDSYHFANWTSKEDKKHFLKISKEYGLIMMGENTFKTLPGTLPNRLNVVFSCKKNLKEEKDLKYVEGDPEKVLKELEDLGYGRALLCGGTFLNSQFLKKQLISDLIITIEPKLFGQGLSLFDTSVDYSLELKELKKINKNSLTLKYKVIY
jgi:dihydrofolate reductase